MKTPSYLVIEDISADALADRLKPYLDQGYVPSGGVAVSHVPGGMLYSQAVVLATPEQNANWSDRGGLPDCLQPPQP